MKTTIKTLVVASTLLGSAIFAHTAIAGDADFTLVNRTGYPIRSVYIAPAKSKTWGNDRLGDGILENKQSRLIKFSDKARCTQSLNVTFDDDGSEVEWDDFNLCELTKITLKYNRKTGEVSADEE
ncbi:MAG: hypothetical protein KGM99_14055 [Burkholderiales bacterium]|nr:hypothetical protein [Burkholderiales bacterium]